MTPARPRPPPAYIRRVLNTDDLTRRGSRRVLPALYRTTVQSLAMSSIQGISLEEAVKTFLNQMPSDINIFLVGKTGAGKSSLVNSLIGEKVAKESAGPDSCTTSIQKYESTIRCQDLTRTIKIIVWDSPGFEDVEEGEGQDGFFKQMETVKNESEIDLVLFCTPLNENRWRTDDTKTIKAIHEAFGPSIWDHAMIALTQANLIQDSKGPVTSAAYKEKVSQWTRKIHSVLKRLGVQKEVAAVPTGNFADMSLPNTDDWFSDFWTTAICSLRSDKRLALLRVNDFRIKFSDKHGRASTRSADPGNNTAPMIDLSGERGRKVEESLMKSFLCTVGNVALTAAEITLVVGYAVASEVVSEVWSRHKGEIASFLFKSVMNLF